MLVLSILSSGSVTLASSVRRLNSNSQDGADNDNDNQNAEEQEEGLQDRFMNDLFGMWNTSPSSWITAVSYTHLTLPTTPYV